MGGNASTAEFLRFGFWFGEPIGDFTGCDVVSVMGAGWVIFSVDAIRG